MVTNTETVAHNAYTVMTVTQQNGIKIIVASHRKSVRTKTRMLERPRSSPPIASCPTRSSKSTPVDCAVGVH